MLRSFLSAGRCDSRGSATSRSAHDVAPGLKGLGLHDRAGEQRGMPWTCALRDDLHSRFWADVLAGVHRHAAALAFKTRAKLVLGLRTIDDAQTGAISVVQRDDFLLRTDVHFHTLARWRVRPR
jgi:hypothetical protein